MATIINIENCLKFDETVNLFGCSSLGNKVTDFILINYKRVCSFSSTLNIIIYISILINTNEIIILYRCAKPMNSWKFLSSDCCDCYRWIWTFHLSGKFWIVSKHGYPTIFRIEKNTHLRCWNWLNYHRSLKKYTNIITYYT